MLGARCGCARELTRTVPIGACSGPDQLRRAVQVLEAARDGSRPVAFTPHIGYDVGAKQVARAFMAKAPALTLMTTGLSVGADRQGDLVSVDEAIEVRRGGQ